MNRWAAWILPQVRFAAMGGRQEKFLTLCLQKGVPVSGVRPTPQGFEAWVPARHYKKLRGDARSCRTRLKVLQKRGLVFSLLWMKGRWGLVLGAAAFCLIMAFGGRLVWAVQYRGMGQTQAEELSALLYSMDIGEGSLLNQNTLDRAKGELFRACPGVGWLALNFEKGRLVVEADPAQSSPVRQKEEPRDLLAAADGVILQMNVQEGLAQKQAGQTVAAGEVLVSAARADREGALYYSSPLAEVTALVKKTYRCEQPLEFEAVYPTGRTAAAGRLWFAAKSWDLPGREPPFAQAEYKEYNRPLKILGVALPGRVCRSLWAETARQKITLTPGAAAQRAEYLCRQALYRDFPDAVLRTESIRQEWTGAGVAVFWQVQFEANIAQQKDGQNLK